MARCLPRYRRSPLPSECMCARAQAKAGKAREDSLSEEKRQANQAEVGRLQLELRTTKATDAECDDKCVWKRRKFAARPSSPIT
jgi:hypothetical protein